MMYRYNGKELSPNHPLDKFTAGKTYFLGRRDNYVGLVDDAGSIRQIIYQSIQQKEFYHDYFDEVTFKSYYEKIQSQS